MVNRAASGAVLLSLALAAAACVVAESTADDPTRGGGVEATVGPDVTPPRLMPSEVLDAILDDAAAHAGADRSSLQILTARSVRWPDGSLGCPEPGRFYTQALVDGWWMLIAAGEQEIDYRGAGGSTWRRCATPRVGIPSDPGAY